MLLFRKSSLWGCYKPRHVTKRDVFLFRNSKPYCTVLLYSLIVQPYCTALLYSLIVQPDCTTLLDSLIEQPFWISHATNRDMLLFRKSSLWGVNNRDMSLIKMCFCLRLYGKTLNIYPCTQSSCCLPSSSIEYICICPLYLATHNKWSSTQNALI